MDEDKGKRKRKKDNESRSQKKKKFLQIMSNAEIEEAAAMKQAKSSMLISATDKTQWNLMFFKPNEDNYNAAETLTWNIAIRGAGANQYQTSSQTHDRS